MMAELLGASLVGAPQTPRIPADGLPFRGVLLPS